VEPKYSAGAQMPVLVTFSPEGKSISPTVDSQISMTNAAQFHTAIRRNMKLLLQPWQLLLLILAG
jgi:hypothetical protein